MALQYQFEWSEREYSLQEFVEKYKKSLPILIRTASGFSGYDGSMHEVGAGELFWIFAIQKQERVIAKDDDDRYVSIPVEYPFKFQKLESDSSPVGEPQLISDISKDFPQSQRIMFESSPKIVFDVRTTFAACSGGKKMNELEMIDTYKEKYLLTHSYLQNDVQQSVLGIPVYIPVTVNVLLGFGGGREAEFKEWMQKVTQYGAQLKDKRIKPCTDILVFGELPPGDYEYINPTMILRQAKKQTSASVVSGKSVQMPHNTTNFYHKFSKTLERRLPYENCTVNRDDKSSILSSSHAVKSSASSSAITSTEVKKANMSEDISTTPPNDSNMLYNTENRDTKKYAIRPLPSLPKTSSPTAKTAAVVKESCFEKPIHSADSAVSERGTKLFREMSDSSVICPIFPSGNFCDTKIRNIHQVAPMEPSSSPISPKMKLSSPKVTEHWKIPPRLPPPRPDIHFETDVQGRTCSTDNTTATNAGKQNQDINTPPYIVMKRKPFPATDRNNVLSKKSSSVDDLYGSNSTLHPETSFSHKSSYRTLEDLPTDVSHLGVAQICSCLEILGLSTHVTGFKEFTIDGCLLMTLTEDILVSDLNMRAIDAHRLLQFAKHGWRPNMS